MTRLLVFAGYLVGFVAVVVAVAPVPPRVPLLAFGVVVLLVTVVWCAHQEARGG